MTFLIISGILLAGLSWVFVFEPYLITNHLAHLVFDIQDEISTNETDEEQISS
jgi:hypothetical protein